MAGQVYFGNGIKQTWIPAPLTNMAAGSQGWAVETQKLSGRKSVKRSTASHRVFNASWIGDINSTDMAESLHTIKDFADGIYGPGPFYWLDPYATKTNILPPHWASPMLAEGDWPKLDASITPTFTAATVANDFPYKYAQYVTTGAYASSRKLTVIIPTGYNFLFGWHGPSGGSSTGIRIVPYLRSTGAADTALNPTMITAGGTTRTNTTISGTTYSKVEIFLATSSAATVRITGMIGQILPIGTSVASGGFITGRGSYALEFTQAPEIEYYSANLSNGKIGMSVKWVEVE